MVAGSGLGPKGVSRVGRQKPGRAKNGFSEVGSIATSSHCIQAVDEPPARPFPWLLPFPRHRTSSFFTEPPRTRGSHLAKETATTLRIVAPDRRRILQVVSLATQ